MGLLDLPELLHALAGYLTPVDLGQCVKVSRYWNDAFIPYLWQDIDDHALNWHTLLAAATFDINPPLNGPTPSISKPSTVLISLLPRVQAEKELEALFMKYGHHIKTLDVSWPVSIQSCANSILDPAAARVEMAGAAKFVGGCTRLTSLILDLGQQFADMVEFYEAEEELEARGELAPVKRHDGSKVEAGVDGDEDVDEEEWEDEDDYDDPAAHTTPLIVERMIHSGWRLVEANKGPTLRKLRVLLNHPLDFSVKLRTLLKPTLVEMPNLDELEAPFEPLDMANLAQVAPKVQTLYLNMDPVQVLEIMRHPGWEQSMKVMSLKSLYTSQLYERGQVGILLAQCPKLELLGLEGFSSGDGMAFLEEEYATHEYPPGAFPNLKNLTVGCPKHYQEYLMEVLIWLPNLCHLSVHGFGMETVGVLKAFCPKLEHLSLGVMQSQEGEVVMRFALNIHGEPVEPLPQDQGVEGLANHILSSLSNLKSFVAIKETIEVSEIAKAPWVCHGLQNLQCLIKLPEAYNRVHFREDGGIFVKGHAITPEEDKDAVEERNIVEADAREFNQKLIEFWETSRAQHQVLFQQLARLKDLKVLRIGHDCQLRVGGGGIAESQVLAEYHGVPMMTLEMGLETLKGLEKLREVEFDNTMRDMGNGEFEWMSKYWKELKMMRMRVNGLKIELDVVKRRVERQETVARAKRQYEMLREQERRFKLAHEMESRKWTFS